MSSHILNGLRTLCRNARWALVRRSPLVMFEAHRLQLTEVAILKVQLQAAERQLRALNADLAAVQAARILTVKIAVDATTALAQVNGAMMEIALAVQKVRVPNGTTQKIGRLAAAGLA